MSNDRKLFVPESLPEHERPLGRMLSEARGTAFAPLRSLAEAQAAPDGFIILQGDDGGQIYVVCPAQYARCSADALDKLLRDLDEIAWPRNPEDMRHIYFERLPEGSGVAGSMGGGRAGREPWIHSSFLALGLEAPILAVLQGERASIRQE